MIPYLLEPYPQVAATMELDRLDMLDFIEDYKGILFSNGGGPEDSVYFWLIQGQWIKIVPPKEESQ